MTNTATVLADALVNHLASHYDMRPDPGFSDYPTLWIGRRVIVLVAEGSEVVVSGYVPDGNGDDDLDELFSRRYDVALYARAEGFLINKIDEARWYARGR